MTLETKSFEDALSSILDEFDINELSALQESAHAPEDELDEIRLYCDVDPVLADMYKHYADAKSEQASILASHGKNDPMADVAFDRVDSAWSAIVTRLLELREDTDAAKALGKRLIVLEEERLGKSRPEDEDAGKPTKPSADIDPFFELAQERAAAEELKRQEREKEKEDEILAAFLVIFIATSFANISPENIFGLNTQFAFAA